MARQELEQDAFVEDVSGVAMSIEQQLQHGPDRDEAVMSLVGSDDANSNHVNLVWMRYRNCVDEVLVSELRTKVDRASGKAGILLLFSCN